MLLEIRLETVFPYSNVLEGMNSFIPKSAPLSVILCDAVFASLWRVKLQYNLMQFIAV